MPCIGSNCSSQQGYRNCANNHCQQKEAEDSHEGEADSWVIVVRGRPPRGACVSWAFLLPSVE